MASDARASLPEGGETYICGTDLRAAHDRNDETLERIYVGRRFRNDTERLEKLFELYTQVTAKQAKVAPGAASQPVVGAKAARYYGSHGRW
jgi:hypothetical protein